MPEGVRPGRRAGTWEVRVTLPVVGGQRREMTRIVEGGVREAKRARAVLLLEREKRWGDRRSLGGHLRWWLELIAADHSPNTLAGYRAYVERYVIPTIGDLPLSRVTPTRLTDLYSALTERGLAPATVRQCHAIIRRGLAVAVALDLIPSNPASRAYVPRVAPPQISPPTPEAFTALLAACADESLRAFLCVAAGTGGRRAEICGLRWGDFDPVGPTLLIQRSVVQVNGRWEDRSPKTGRARRIALDGGTAQVLQEQIDRVRRRASQMGVALVDNPRVFTDAPNGEAPWRPDRVTLAFRRLVGRLGLEMRLHDLRHLHATQLLAMGHDVRTVAGRLGHAHANTTLNIYAHFVPEADRRAADAIGAKLGL